jgi:HEAT repeat protein
MLKRSFIAAVFLMVAFLQVLPAQQEREEIAPMVDEKYGSASEIMALGSKALVKVVKDPEASVFARAKACQRLAVVGKEPAIPALEMLLPQEELSHYARFALEAIPGRSVNEALRRALDKVEGELLIGVINSIGHRRDTEALPALSKLLHSSDNEVSEAAAAALSRIRPAR